MIRVKKLWISTVRNFDKPLSLSERYQLSSFATSEFLSLSCDHCMPWRVYWHGACVRCSVTSGNWFHSSCSLISSVLARRSDIVKHVLPVVGIARKCVEVGSSPNLSSLTPGAYNIGDYHCEYTIKDEADSECSCALSGGSLTAIVISSRTNIPSLRSSLICSDCCIDHRFWDILLLCQARSWCSNYQRTVRLRCS